MKSQRRNFIKKSGILISAGLIARPLFSFSSPVKKITVGEIMDLFISQVPGGRKKQTVDTLKSGSGDQQVSGIVTTMFATISVIRKSIELKANFIIAHEPTFYNHLDETEWLAADPIYQFKRRLLEENGIAVWRNHDYVHSLSKDGVVEGVIEQLVWEKYYQRKSIVMLPETSLGELISHVKEKMNIPAIRYVGDLSQKAIKILLLPGAIGGKRQIELLMQEKPDVLICGESPEWETPEYIRNANEMGEKLAMIVLGHSASEEAGSEFLAEWVKTNVPGMPVYHIPSGNSLSIE
jgi:putative NIF3 family GTP cyclohydrolase 1 type 2